MRGEIAPLRVDEKEQNINLLRRISITDVSTRNKKLLIYSLWFFDLIDSFLDNLISMDKSKLIIRLFFQKLELIEWLMTNRNYAFISDF